MLADILKVWQACSVWMLMCGNGCLHVPNSHPIVHAQHSQPWCILCTANPTEEDVSVYPVARLRPREKRPAVGPIAVGKVFRRIFCKVIMKIIQRNVYTTAPLHVRVGVPSTCDAAVHSVDCLFCHRYPSIHRLLLVDASNAFNALNRLTSLHKVVLRVCPAVAQVFLNPYSQPTGLFVTGGGEDFSQDGTCLGVI